MKELIKLFSIILVISSSSSACAGGRGKGYIYDAANIGDQRAVVFNSAVAEVSIQNKSGASIDVDSHGFGGTFRYCGNKKYYCISGPINIAIPKNISNLKSIWRYRKISCKGQPGRLRDVYTVICKSGMSGVESVVEFSSLRGILSFKNTPIGGDSLFRLRGYKGIFSETESRKVSKAKVQSKARITTTPTRRTASTT